MSRTKHARKPRNERIAPLVIERERLLVNMQRDRELLEEHAAPKILYGNPEWTLYPEPVRLQMLEDIRDRLSRRHGRLSIIEAKLLKASGRA